MRTSQSLIKYSGGTMERAVDGDGIGKDYSEFGERLFSFYVFHSLMLQLYA